jgi:glycine/D-amino acid oxidase-like deaminating enzyme
LKSDRRVVIIGAGIAGVATALDLLDRGGSEVVILERFGPGFGSSSKSAGVIETQYLDRSAIEVRAHGLQYFERFAEDHEVSLVRSGYLRLAEKPSDLEEFERSIEMQREFGINDPELIDATEIERRWPRIRMEGRVGGLFGPSDGYIDSYEFTLNGASKIIRLGGRIVNGVEVLGVKEQGDGSLELQTNAGEFVADYVVNAAGPWARNVAALFGLDIPQNNQLRPKIKLDHETPIEPLLPFVMDYVPGSGQDGIYFRSETPHELFVGIHTDESIAEERDPDIHLGSAPQAFIERVRDLLPARLDIPENVRLGETWTGLYAISPDNKPIVDIHPEMPRVVHVMGAGGSGIQLAPAMSKIAADLVTNQTPSAFPNTDWSLSRFPQAVKPTN